MIRVILNNRVMLNGLCHQNEKQQIKRLTLRRELGKKGLWNPICHISHCLSYVMLYLIISYLLLFNMYLMSHMHNIISVLFHCNYII